MTKLRGHFKMFLQFLKTASVSLLILTLFKLISIDKTFLLHFFSAPWNFLFFITSVVDKSYSGLQMFLSSYA
jgi:hypothetical protein